MASSEATSSQPSHDLEKEVALSPVAISLTWSNLSFAVKGREVPILSDVNGEISSGRLLAVMGPSGAGKSTFLDVLCRRTSARTGEVRPVFSAASAHTDFSSFQIDLHQWQVGLPAY